MSVKHDPRRWRSFAAGVCFPSLAIIVLFLGPGNRYHSATLSPVQNVEITGPDTVEFSNGPLHLRALVWRPQGDGSFPAVLFNHGSGADYTREMAAVGPVYARHGWFFFAPARRGQWLSVNTGGYILDSLNAVGRTQGQVARERVMVDLLTGPQIDDVRAALDFLRTQPIVDRNRIIVAGNSFGGIMTVLASARLDGLRAAVDFAGAAQTWASSPNLQVALRAAAEHARVPILFVQAENDYDLSPSRELGAVMDRAGLPNRVQIFPPYGSTTPEGHSFGYFGGAIWAPVVFDWVATQLGG